MAKKRLTKNEKLIAAIKALNRAYSELTYRQTWANDGATCNEDHRATFEAVIAWHTAAIALEALLPGYHTANDFSDLASELAWAKKSIEALDAGEKYLPSRYDD